MGRRVSDPRATAGLASSAEGGVSTTKRPCMDSTPRDSQLSTQAARRKADELLGDIQRLISATGVIASVTPGAEETAAFIESLMHDMNAVIRSYRTAWRQSEGQKQARRNGKPAEEAPAEGEESPAAE